MGIILGALGALGSLAIVGINIWLSRKNNDKNIEQNRLIAQRREELERAIRENQQERALRIMREGQQLMLELEAKRHEESLNELVRQFDDLLKNKAYERTIETWPLKTLPIVMKNQAFGNLITNQNENVALHCILTPSNNRDFNNRVFPHLESKIEQYCNLYWSNMDSKPVLFYSGAWKENGVNDTQITSLRNTLSNLPTLVIRPFFRPTDKRLIFQIDMWGFDGDNLSQKVEPVADQFQRDYKANDNWSNDAELINDAIEDLVPYLQCAVGLMVDTYFWSVFGKAPTLPKLLTDGTINVDGMKYLQHDASDYYDSLLEKGKEALKDNPFIENQLLSLLEGCCPFNGDAVNRDKLFRLLQTCYSIRTGKKLVADECDLTLNYIVSLMMSESKVGINDGLAIMCDLQSKLESIAKDEPDSSWTYRLNKPMQITVGDVTFNMMKVEADSFMMGDANSDPEAQDNAKPQHKVTLTKDYYIGETVVTQALWREVMTCLPKALTDDPKLVGDDKPVVYVSWTECKEFIDKLNEKTKGKFGTFCFPTEAQWEYAAKGGPHWQEHEYRYSGSDNLDEVGWYSGNRGDQTLHEVKTKKANDLGIYDMSGNVWEWCGDRWNGPYLSSSQTDFFELLSLSRRVNRGGGWDNVAMYCRSSDRIGSAPDYASSDLGLRLVLLF